MIVRDAATGKETVRFKPAEGYVFDALFSPDGKRVLTKVAGMYNNANAVQIWDANSGKLLLALQAFGSVDRNPPAARSVSFSPDGRRILLLSRNDFSIWDSETGMLLHTARPARTADVSDYLISTQFSPDGKLILTEQCNGLTRIWRSDTGELVHTFGTEFSKDPTEPAQPYALFSPDGRSVLSSAPEGGVAILWDVASGKEVRRFQMPGRNPRRMDEMIFSNDGKRLITTCESLADTRHQSWVRNGVLWDVETGRKVLELPTRPQGGDRIVGFSPSDQTLMTVYHDRPSVLWDGATGKAIGGLRWDGAVESAISPEEK